MSRRRDGARSGAHVDALGQFGISPDLPEAKPWLPLGEDHATKECWVTLSQGKKIRFLCFYQKIHIPVCRSNEALISGGLKVSLRK